MDGIDIIGGVIFLGSARASRAGEGAIAFANFPAQSDGFRRGAESPSRTGISTRGACAPQTLEFTPSPWS